MIHIKMWGNLGKFDAQQENLRKCLGYSENESIDNPYIQLSVTLKNIMNYLKIAI